MPPRAHLEHILLDRGDEIVGQRVLVRQVFVGQAFKRGAPHFPIGTVDQPVVRRLRHDEFFTRARSRRLELKIGVGQHRLVQARRPKTDRPACPAVLPPRPIGCAPACGTDRRSSARTRPGAARCSPNRASCTASDGDQFRFDERERRQHLPVQAARPARHGDGLLIVGIDRARHVGVDHQHLRPAHESRRAFADASNSSAALSARCP